MFIFPFKKHEKIKLLLLLNYCTWGFIALMLITASWLLFYIYEYLYSTLIQESVIVDLKSQLIITKVDKRGFDLLMKNVQTKTEPLTKINFQDIPNPFKTVAE